MGAWALLELTDADYFHYSWKTKAMHYSIIPLQVISVILIFRYSPSSSECLGECKVGVTSRSLSWHDVSRRSSMSIFGLATEANATNKDGGLPTVFVTCSSVKLLSCKICHVPYVWKKPFYTCLHAWARAGRERSWGMCKFEDKFYCVGLGS